MITAFATIGTGDPSITLSKHLDTANLVTTLPIVLDYVAEGAANVILRLVPLPASSRLGVAPPALLHRVLRLRKAKPSLASVATQHAHLTSTVLPLFPPGIIAEHALVSITPDLLVAIDAVLAHLPRPPSRASDVLDTASPFAQLIADLSLPPPGVTLEFKPKWLLQSPSAPAGAKRCRTCALRAMRRTPPGHCPLALLGTPTQRRKAAKAIVASNRASEHLGARLADVLVDQAGPVLRLLRELQGRLDPGGVLALREGEDPPRDLLLAMTVRDCALFMQVPADGEVLVRLADLDAKPAHADRLGRWVRTERALVERGWYTNTEEAGEVETICVLSET